MKLLWSRRVHHGRAAADMHTIQDPKHSHLILLCVRKRLCSCCCARARVRSAQGSAALLNPKDVAIEVGHALDGAKILLLSTGSKH